MRLTGALVLVLCCLISSHAAAQLPAAPNEPTGSTPAPDPRAEVLLKEINSLNPYQTPDLPLKTDQQYAHTVKELEPFHHVEPFKTHFRKQLEVTGPGRTLPEPTDLKSVKVGFLGPLYPTVSAATGGKSHEEILGKKMYQGSVLAIEEANARGGYLKRKLPFELVVSNDNGLWGSSANEIIKQTYKDGVWAILGTIDGANSHIAIRVALKCEILMMNSGDTDPTFIETNIPWVARCIGDDRQMNYILVDYMYRKAGFKRGDHPRQQSLRPFRGPRAQQRQPAARASDHRRDGLQGGHGRLRARAGTAQGREPGRGDPLGRRGRRCEDPQPDARDGNASTLRRLRPLRFR